MNVPLNGRIAIIDDEISQVEPLLRVLSKNQIPYTFYKGNDISYLPDADSRFNDIRILFLDINLVDEKATLNEKLVKSTLISVLKRVISPENFPYTLIFWSRHQKEHEALVRELFENELRDRRPISINGFVKSDFFPDFSNEEVENDIDIIQELNKIINLQLSYSYLINWENQVHTASDRTLQEIFSSYHTFEDWTDNANHLINKLGISYSGKAFDLQNPAGKIKSAYNSLTYLVNDTLEKNINSIEIENAEVLKVDSSSSKLESFHSINRKLLFSIDDESLEYPGTVIEDQNPKTESSFLELLNNCFSRSKIEAELTAEEVTNKTVIEINKLISRTSSDKRKKIRSTWKRIYLTATPLCDYVQNKYEYNRCIMGMIIDSEHIDYIDTKSEAVFISPRFLFEDRSCVMVLHYRYFFTSAKGGGSLKYLKPLFRARQQLLAEIQSKLSRHISRQGILFLDDN